MNGVIEALKNNSKLNEESKKNIMEIVNIIYSKSHVNNFTNLINRLSNLEIIEKPLKNQVIKLENNQIVIDPNQIRYYDQKLALTSVIIEAMRLNTDFNTITEPISLGFNESYAQSLVGVEGRPRYEEEQVYARMLGKMIGDDNLINIYFMGNMPVDLPNYLLRSGCKEADIKKLLTMIYQNYKNRNIR